VTIQKPAYDKAQLNLALEASIYIGLAILLAAACLLILLPFIPLLAWGIIISVAAYPVSENCRRCWEDVKCQRPSLARSYSWAC